MGQQNCKSWSCRACSGYVQEPEIVSVQPHPEIDGLKDGFSEIVDFVPTIKAVEAQGGKLQKCNSSEPADSHSSESTDFLTVPPPDASLQSTPNNSPSSERFSKSEIREMVKEFQSEAMSGKGVSCKIYQKESDSIELKTCTMFLNMDAASIRLSVNNSKYSKQLLELSLASIRVFDSEQLKSQSSSKTCDSDMVELEREDPGNVLHLSIFLVLPEETYRIVLDDERLMHKSKYGLMWLSKYFRQMAREDKVSGD